MRASLISILFLIFSNFAFACENPAKDRDLYALFYVHNQPTQWKAVRGKGFRRDRGTRITVSAGSSVSNSRVDFKGKTHSLGQVSFCINESSKVTVSHPEHGELVVRRFKRGLDSYILLSKGLITLRLRPSEVVEN